MSPTNAHRSLIALRTILGAVSYLRPDIAARAFGIDPDESPSIPSAIRLFGAREAAMALAIATRSPEQLSLWLKVGAGVDALDVLTVAMGASRRQLGGHTIVVGAGMASFAVALGVRALRGHRPSR